MPRLREFRLAKSEQILPLIANRKPASDRTHWIRSNLRHARPGAGRAWRGTGRPAEFSPSGFHPVTGIAYRQEDRRVRLLNRVVSQTARRALHTLSRNEKFEFFWCPLPWGSECSGNYQPRGNGKTARESARQIPACSRLKNSKFSFRES